MVKLILIFISLFLIVGCNSEEYVPIDSLEVTDHFAIEDSLSGDEWQDFIAVTVNSENIITAIELNSVSKLANNLRRDIAQLEGFEEAFGYNFYDQASSLEQSLIGTPSDELVDALRNAYADEIVDFDTTTFANLADLALSSESVQQGPYIDGAYHSIEAIDEDELQYFVNLYILNGYIVAVHFNASNLDGRLKYDQLISMIPDIDIIEWRHQAQILEQALIRFQDPMEFAFDDYGYATNIPGVDINIEPFVSLAIQALANGPVIDEAKDE